MEQVRAGVTAAMFACPGELGYCDGFEVDLTSLRCFHATTPRRVTMPMYMPNFQRQRASNLLAG